MSKVFAAAAAAAVVVTTGAYAQTHCYFDAVNQTFIPSFDHVQLVLSPQQGFNLTINGTTPNATSLEDYLDALYCEDGVDFLMDLNAYSEPGCNFNYTDFVYAGSNLTNTSVLAHLGHLVPFLCGVPLDVLFSQEESGINFTVILNPTMAPTTNVTMPNATLAPTTMNETTLPPTFVLTTNSTSNHTEYEYENVTDTLECFFGDANQTFLTEFTAVAHVNTPDHGFQVYNESMSNGTTGLSMEDYLYLLYCEHGVDFLAALNAQSEFGCNVNYTSYVEANANNTNSSVLANLGNTIPTFCDLPLQELISEEVSGSNYTADAANSTSPPATSENGTDNGTTNGTITKSPTASGASSLRAGLMVFVSVWAGVICF